MRWLVFSVSARRVGVGDLEDVTFPSTWLEAVGARREELDGLATAIPLDAVEGFAGVSRTWAISSEAATEAAGKATSDGEEDAHEVQARLRSLLAEATERRVVVTPVERPVEELLGLVEPLAVNHHAENAVLEAREPKPFTPAPDEDPDRLGL